MTILGSNGFMEIHVNDDLAGKFQPY